MWFGSKQGSQTLVSGVAHQGLQTETNGFRVGRGAASFLSLLEQLFVDI
jgi:hypothetical protein